MRVALLTFAASGLLGACSSAPEGPVTEAGDLATGDMTLSSGEFRDGFTVRLEPGQWLTVDLRSTAFDPYLIVRTPAEDQSENDDATPGDHTHARLVFQATETGEHNIIVTSFEPGETGAYTLIYEVADAEPAGGATPPPEPVAPGPPPADRPAADDTSELGGGIRI